MRRENSLINRLIRILLFIVVMLGVAFLAYQAFLYQQSRRFLPLGTTIGGVDVGGLELNEAQTKVETAYNQPVSVYHFEDMVQINPPDVGFTLDIATMMAEAEKVRTQQEFGPGFLSYLLQRPLQPVQIELIATHSPELVAAMVNSIANYLDKPMSLPQIEPTNLTFQAGENGYTTDIIVGINDVAAALYRLDNRIVHLVVQDEVSPAPGFALLQTYIENKISTFPGGGSFFIMDLQTGEEIAVNADQAMSGTSIMKIAIVLETFRALNNNPDIDQTKLISETLVVSGNYSANLLLDVVAGQNNAYLGSDILTASMQQLGLENTFMVTPYEEPARAERPTLRTPANTNPENQITVDPAMQTTARDIGTLLSMIYYCTQGKGALLAVYPDQLTPNECQQILHYMSMDLNGFILRAGVPPCTIVAHKHGWIDGDVGFHGTHGDAAIIETEGRHYVIVTFVYTEGWMDWTISFPFMADISRAVYNYYNQETPYLEDVLREGIATNTLELPETSCGELAVTNNQ